MFTGSISAYSNQTTDELRQWVGGAVNGLQAAGLTNTNAVGTIDPTTITAASGSAASYGFVVFTFADSLQSTHPIFVRLEFRNRPVLPPNAQAPAMDVTVGTTHNGSGSVGGQSRSFSYFFTGGTSDRTNGQYSIFAAGDGWMNAAFWYTLSSGPGINSWLLNIERTRDANGNITPEGFSVHCVGTENGTDIRSAYIPMSGSLPLSQTRWGILRSPAGDATFTNGNVMPGRVFHLNGSALPTPLTSLMVPWAAAFKTNDIVAFSPYQSMMAKYMRLPVSSVYSAANGIDGRVLMRIE
jgi:hypothetical protein